MKKLSLLVLLIFTAYHLSAQFQDITWIFGRPQTGTTNATLYFGDLSNPVVNLPTGQPNQITTGNGGEQWAVVTNPYTGALIFYTDGKNVFDKQNNLVSSVNLGGNTSSSQPVAIAPIPHTDTLKSLYRQYYIFSNGTGAVETSYTIGTVTCRIYDAISQTFGETTGLPGPYGFAQVTEGMKIVPSDTDPDVLWLIVSLFPDVPANSFKYVVYKIDRDIVSYAGNYDFGPQKLPLPGSGASPILFITSSKAGTGTGTTNIGISVQYTSAVFTIEFDNVNGNFRPSTVKRCDPGYSSSVPSVYNLEFSPNGNFLYYTVYKTFMEMNELYQVDLGNSFFSPTLVHTFPETYAGGLKRGPDGLVYHISDNGYFTGHLQLGRILQPDALFIPGVTAFGDFYQEDFKVYNNVFGFGLCEFTVLPDGTKAGLPDLASGKSGTLAVYPNPAQDFVTITATEKISGMYDVSLVTLQGAVILNKKMQADSFLTLDVSSLDAGAYLISLQNRQDIFRGKLIIRK
ncbi:MAG: T9SS type A sorting domain-containing protein [Bacteroidota bacterium]